VTLRQILDVLWKRKWIVISVVLIAVLTAFAYLQLRTVTYSSSGIIRLNTAVTEAALSGGIGGVAMEVDDAVISSPTILEPAAEALGEAPETLAGSIAVLMNADERLVRARITAHGPTPDIARERASAVIESYQAYIDEQMAQTLTTLQQRQQEAIDEARALQDQVARNPGDSISSTRLATALGKMTSLTSAIEGITSAGANSTVLSPPAPGALTVPPAVIVLLLALASGLIIGIAVALIRDQFDDRLRSEDEVESFAKARSIGELSWDRKVAAAASPLPVAGNERTDLAERLRTLRSNLAVFLPPRGAAFVVTSVEPGDGKSFVSANLALAWARAGKRVILVGGDLRRPNLARYFGDAADGEGLSDILAHHDVGEPLDKTAVKATLNTTTYRRLLILPPGPESAEPADLIARPITAELIAYLRTLADVVIIDSPPAIGMADAALLAAHTDGAVVLASVRRTDRVRLVEAIEALRAAGVEVLGVVSNRSRRKLPKTYSSYYVAAERPARTPALSIPVFGKSAERDDDDAQSPDRDIEPETEKPDGEEIDLDSLFTPTPHEAASGEERKTSR